MRALLLATSAFACLGVPFLALAQDAAPPSVQAERSEGLEVIVVTAQRREESLQRAAVALTAVTGKDLAKLGVTETSNLGRLVPSLVVQPTGGTTSFFLRIQSRSQTFSF